MIFNLRERNGYGKAFYLDGSMFEGFWTSDKYSYFGRLIFSDGDAYVSKYS